MKNLHLEKRLWNAAIAMLGAALVVASAKLTKDAAKDTFKKYPEEVKDLDVEVETKE